MFKHHFTLVGLNDAAEPQFQGRVLEAIQTHRVFAGGTRHKTLVEHLLPSGYTWFEIKSPIDEVLQELECAQEPVLVFASGDPLFYGFGATLQRRFPTADYQFFPTFNSLQLLAHRLGLAYQNMENTSVTGRSWQELDAALLRSRPLIGVLTDKRKTPQEIAGRLQTYGFSGYEIIVGEALGGPNEQIHTLSIEEVQSATFQDLNCVILKQTEASTKYFGIDEGQFAGLPGRPNMITKMPFRLVSLSQLNLSGAQTFFDIGFCTGSVSIEARLLFPHLQIAAFEKRPECEAIFRENARRFRTPGVRIIMEDFLTTDLQQALKPFTTLDAAFIGGHGGKIHEIFKRLVPIQHKGGRIVMNTVKPESDRLFQSAANSYGYQLHEPLHLCMNQHNPITILTAEKN
jgi:precorrin-6Y C5,15-methyltransferase (decarboxylating)